MKKIATTIFWLTLFIFNAWSFYHTYEVALIQDHYNNDDEICEQ